MGSLRYDFTRRRALSPAVPYLRISGRWLDAAGFGVGSRLHIAVDRGRLVVTVDRVAEPDS